MNWNDKAKEIAEAILAKMEDGFTREDVLNGLHEAAMNGIKFECDAWCHGKSEQMQQCCETMIELLK